MSFSFTGPVKTTSRDGLQAGLLILAAVFLGFHAIAITLSPAARMRDWDASYRWGHWLGYAAWLLAFIIAHRETARRLPGRDPYLLPVAALLTGWGLQVIWRLMPEFGLRQTIWLLVAAGALVAGLRLPGNLAFLRRYKYLWLTGGLLITGLTLVLGTNPLGYGPRMWLGCCGLYLQPSEPLKLLLIIYLAAYLADRRNVSATLASFGPVRSPLLPLLAPTLIMTGLALALLLIQRDLGTATIFLFLYAAVVYISSGRKEVLVITAVGVLAAGVAGTLMFDVVRIRVNSWINPWADPSGESYQIVQSLIAIANGGVFGRGPGLGSPGLVPIPHSDFIFAAIAEETGLVGALALLMLIGLMATRGLRAALHAPGYFRRFLAAGLTTYLAAQSILIIGGNVRLLPLTGVTLPFISYGGSSLVTTYLSLLLLLHISNTVDEGPAALAAPRLYTQLHGFILGGLVLVALVLGWWTVVRGPELVARTDNPRRAIADRYVKRGAILDRNLQPINATFGASGSYEREALYPPLSNVVGYTHLAYGQAGLEASLDDTLRGLEGNPPIAIWWNRVLYGQPPPGNDVRLSLDLNFQKLADEALAGHTGGLVLMDPLTGQILAMASRPTFDANDLEEIWERLISDESAPLLNRAAQGSYPPGGSLASFFLAAVFESGPPPAFPSVLDLTYKNVRLECARPVAATAAVSSAEQASGQEWSDAVAAGCPAAQLVLGEALGVEAVTTLLNKLGFYQAPEIRLPVSGSAPEEPPEPTALLLGQAGPRLSPLQMALAASAISNGGYLPAPQLLLTSQDAELGWKAVTPLDGPQRVYEPQAAAAAAVQIANGREAELWEALATAPKIEANGPQAGISWYMGGTLPGSRNRPLVLALALEDGDAAEAQAIGQAVLQALLER